jgi:uncharacterized protein (DUF2141 family)
MRSLFFLGAFPLAACLATASMASAAQGDYDGDGAVSREEFRNQVARTAFAADKNQNGFIEPEEYKLTDAQRRSMDANRDGKVSVEEFQAGQLAGFDALDKNGNGKLEASERGG